jgi:peptidoglycan/LPS O-acetylase OafA/YrhL
MLRMESQSAVSSAPLKPLVLPAPRFGGYLGQFDSYRVIACCAVVLQHSLLWTIAASTTTAWAFVMLLHFSRTAFFFLTAFLLTYSQITRPRSTVDFWRRRFVQIGVPFLVWTGIYWAFTLIENGSFNQAGSLLWRDVVYGYYQLYFAVVLLQLYVVFPLALRLVRRDDVPRLVEVGRWPQLVQAAA